MPFQVSPGVLVKEVDLTNVVPAVSTSIGAIAGNFEKGPVSEITAISSEEELVRIFGKPNGSNFETFFAASNFLQYGNALRVVRAESAIVNATSGGSGGSGVLIKSDTHYQENFASGQAEKGEWGARTAGTIGNSLGVSMCTSAAAYEQTLDGTGAGEVNGTPAAGATTVTISAAGGAASNHYNEGDIVHFGEADGQQYEVTAISGADLTIRQLDNPNGGGLKSALTSGQAVRRRWKYYDLFDSAPGTSPYATGKGVTNDEMHIVVFDNTGDITGFRTDTAGERTGAVIETYAFLSQHPNSKTPQGGTNYYPDVIFKQSGFVYWLDHLSSVLTHAGTVRTAGQAYDNGTGTSGEAKFTLSGGADDDAVTVGELDSAYQLFADAETVDVNLIVPSNLGSLSSEYSSFLYSYPTNIATGPAGILNISGLDALKSKEFNSLVSFL